MNLLPKFPLHEKCNVLLEQFMIVSLCIDMFHNKDHLCLKLSQN